MIIAIDSSFLKDKQAILATPARCSRGFVQYCCTIIVATKYCFLVLVCIYVVTLYQQDNARSISTVRGF